MQLTGPWTREEASASGQVFEFRLWGLLTEQSRGQLHVFLPLADRGIDGLIHRRTDDVYIPVQAKGRTALNDDGEVHLVVWAESLRDDEAVLVSGLVTEGGLGPTMLVVPEVDFKRLAESSTWDGRPIYSMGFSMRPHLDSRWLPHLVPTSRLSERFGVAQGLGVAAQMDSSRTRRQSDLGFLGEAEVVRLFAEEPRLNLFRAFPDLETAEIVTRELSTKRVLGIQIKTIGVDAANPSGTVTILASSFRASTTTSFACVAWLWDQHRFHDECLLIPSTDIASIAEPSDRAAHLSFDWHPGSPAASQLDRYRMPRLDLAGSVISRLSAPN